MCYIPIYLLKMKLNVSDICCAANILCFTGSYYLFRVYVAGANKGPIVCPEADSDARHKDLFFGHVIRIFFPARTFYTAL